MKLTEVEKQTIRDGQTLHLREGDVECVVVRADIFQRLRAVLDEGLPPEVVGELVDQSMADFDAGDPLFESYQSQR